MNFYFPTSVSRQEEEEEDEEDEILSEANSFWSGILQGLASLSLVPPTSPPRSRDSDDHPPLPSLQPLPTQTLNISSPLAVTTSHRGELQDNPDSASPAPPVPSPSSSPPRAELIWTPPSFVPPDRELPRPVLSYHRDPSPVPTRPAASRTISALNSPKINLRAAVTTVPTSEENEQTPGKRKLSELDKQMIVGTQRIERLQNELRDLLAYVGTRPQSRTLSSTEEPSRDSARGPIVPPAAKSTAPRPSSPQPPRYGVAAAAAAEFEANAVRQLRSHLFPRTLLSIAGTTCISPEKGHSGYSRRLSRASSLPSGFGGGGELGQQLSRQFNRRSHQRLSRQSFSSTTGQDCSRHSARRVLVGPSGSRAEPRD